MFRLRKHFLPYLNKTQSCGVKILLCALFTLTDVRTNHVDTVGRIRAYRGQTQQGIFPQTASGSGSLSIIKNYITLCVHTCVGVNNGVTLVIYITWA